MIILTLMAITTLGIIKLRNLFSVVVLSTIYSFLMATLLLIFDAVDVALTEAAVGAGVSTVLMLTVIYYTKTTEEEPKHSSIIPIMVCLAIGGLLIYGTYGLPPFGASARTHRGRPPPRRPTRSLTRQARRHPPTGLPAAGRARGDASASSLPLPLDSARRKPERHHEYE